MTKMIYGFLYVVPSLIFCTVDASQKTIKETVPSLAIAHARGLQKPAAKPAGKPRPTAKPIAKPKLVSKPTWMGESLKKALVSLSKKPRYHREYFFVSDSVWCNVFFFNA